MAFERPTFPALLERIRADIETRLPGADSRLPFSDLDVLAFVLANAAHDLHAHLDDIARQIHPDTADSANLERHASWWGITRKPATPAKGNVKVVGNAGAVVPAGALLQFGGREYTVDAEVILAGANAQVAVTARIAGSAGNCAAGSTLAFVSPVAGVQSQAKAEAGLTDGAEPEDDRLLLARLLRRMQAPPHGGAKADYVSWALEVPGVTRAWAGQLLDAEGNTVPGSVWLTFVCDGQAGSIIPDAAKVAEVQAHIDARRPVTADVTVAAPTPKPINFTITGLDPVSQAVKDAIAAELADVLEREAVPGATILLSHLREAISLAAGENDHQLTAPAANIAHARHEIAVMGTITWA